MKIEDLLFSLIVSIILLFLMKSLIVSPVIIKGNSMLSTYKSGDITLSIPAKSLEFLNLIKSYDNFSFLKNKTIIVQFKGKKLLKRCIGIPGDTLIFIDGIGKKDSFVVPKDSIFVIGDNYRFSYDSRNFGFIGIDNLKGIILFEN